jgi:hypothetical protein
MRPFSCGVGVCGGVLVLAWGLGVLVLVRGPVVGVVACCCVGVVAVVVLCCVYSCVYACVFSCHARCLFD